MEPLKGPYIALHSSSRGPTQPYIAFKEPYIASYVSLNMVSDKLPGCLPVAGGEPLEQEHYLDSTISIIGFVGFCTRFFEYIYIYNITEHMFHMGLMFD